MRATTITALSIALASQSTAVTAQQFQFQFERTRTPTFVEPAPTNQRIHSPVTGDFDGDGRKDVVFLRSSGLEIQFNLGGGRYVAATATLPSGVPGATREVLTRDVDLDGFDDLVLVSSADIDVYRSLGGTFASPVGVGLAGNDWVGSVRVGDVDGDGDVDFLRSNAVQIRLVRNLGGTSFSAPVPLTGIPGTAALWLADLDGDGDDDLATTAPASPGNLLLANDGNGNFAPGFFASFVGSPEYICAGDVDGDGDVDLVAGGTQLQNTNLHLNLGSGLFSGVTPTFPVPVLLNTDRFFLEDFDRDGDLDFLTLGSATMYMENDGAANFTLITNQRWRAVSGGKTRSVVEDLDGDGDPDVSCVAFRPLTFVNHIRQLVSVRRPQVGDLFEIDMYSGPGFAAPGMVALWASLALPSQPLAMTGIDGLLELDLATAATVAVRPTSFIGVSRVYAPIPNDPTFAGTSIVFQHARIATGSGLGLGNAVLETIVP